MTKTITTRVPLSKKPITTHEFLEFIDQQIPCVFTEYAPGGYVAGSVYYTGLYTDKEGEEKAENILKNNVDESPEEIVFLHDGKLAYVRRGDRVNDYGGYNTYPVRADDSQARVVMDLLGASNTLYVLVPERVSVHPLSDMYKYAALIYYGTKHLPRKGLNNWYLDTALVAALFSLSKIFGLKTVKNRVPERTNRDDLTAAAAIVHYYLDGGKNKNGTN